MSTTTQNVVPTDVPVACPLGTEAANLVLRTNTGEGAERIVPLPIGKSTVGASERCQVHLTSESVRPLHCLIVREPNEITVTSWAPGVTLNGAELTTESLHGACQALRRRPRFK